VTGNLELELNIPTPVVYVNNKLRYVCLMIARVCLHFIYAVFGIFVFHLLTYKLEKHSKDYRNGVFCYTALC